MAYWLFKYALFTPWIYLTMRPRVIGRDKLPKGGVIFAANHSSAFETVFLAAMIPRKVTFLAKVELFRYRRRDVAHNIVAWFLKVVGQVPVDRSGGRSAVDAMGPIVEHLSGNHAVAIFPEGTRSPDGRLYRGKTGVARLALLGEFPVVPVALSNTTGSFGRLLRQRPTIRFGEPVTYAEFLGRQDDADVLRWVTDDVMAHIQDLTGQTYVDMYANAVKSGSASAEVVAAKVLDNPHAGKAKPVPTLPPA